MNDPPRRRFLALCAALATAVAGCTGSQQTEVGEDHEPQRRRDVITDVTTFTTRIERDVDLQQPIAQFDDEADVQSRFPYVIRAEDIDALQFDPRPPEYDDLLAFLRETEYDEQSVFITSREVSGCHRNTLEFVQLRTDGAPEDGVSVDFCQTFRDPDVECSVERRHHQVTLVRFPIGYEVTPSGSGRGWSRRCHGRRERGERR